MKWRVVNDDSPVYCPTCNGQGYLTDDKCSECKGDGAIIIYVDIDPYNCDEDTQSTRREDCNRCNGTGSAKPCPTCHGKKKLSPNSIILGMAKILQLAEHLNEVQSDYEKLRVIIYQIGALSRDVASMIEQNLAVREED